MSAASQAFSGKRVRTLVVDDSATMRSLISSVLRRDPEIEVVGHAANALDAREAIKALSPDVITLDVEMPGASGLMLLQKIMQYRPTPVIMVSSLTQSGTEMALRALELGAVDCVGKPGAGSDGTGFSQLADAVKAASTARVHQVGPPSPPRTARPAGRVFRPECVIAIGASTGGVEALITLLADFPANCPPTLITQHMPRNFTRSFAERLNRSCAAEVAEASEGAPLRPGQIYLAPGGDHHLQVVGSGSQRCRLVAEDPVNGHRPSVDVMFHSVAKLSGVAAVGVLLTGMGRDGAQGLLALRQGGADTLAQDEATCVVYGMPKAAMDIGAAQRQLPLGRLASAALGLCEARSERIA